MRRKSKQSKNKPKTTPQPVTNVQQHVIPPPVLQPLLQQPVIKQTITTTSEEPQSIISVQQKPLVKKITKEVDHSVEKIKKEFKKFAYLPIEGLRKISQSMALYIDEKKKNMDHKDGQFVRFTFRNEIIKILWVSILELKVQNAKAVNSLEEKFIDESTNCLQLLAIVAHNLQCYLYEQLFNPKETKARLQPYQCQIRLLITSLNDVNNLALRRGILNGTISNQFIKGASEVQMMSQETKRKEKQRMIQEVRQSEIWQQRDFNRKTEEKIQTSEQRKNKEEAIFNRIWVREKVNEVKYMIEDIRYNMRRRQQQIQAYVGKLKRLPRDNQETDD